MASKPTPEFVKARMLMLLEQKMVRAIEQGVSSGRVTDANRLQVESTRINALYVAYQQPADWFVGIHSANTCESDAINHLAKDLRQLAQ